MGAIVPVNIVEPQTASFSYLLFDSHFQDISGPICSFKFTSLWKTWKPRKAVMILKQLVSVTIQIHEGEYLNWLHRTILRPIHLFQISWSFGLFYKSIFKTTFSFLFNITFKTYPILVSIYSKIIICQNEIWHSCDIGKNNCHPNQRVSMETILSSCLEYICHVLLRDSPLELI